MPSHITHTLFGFLAADAAGINIRYPEYFTLGCQGPDMFLHGTITAPTARALGTALHREHYGNFTMTLVDSAGSIAARWIRPEDEYILGFITHAVLDRKTHPFINYFSGWGPDYHLCHPFMERLIDVWALKMLNLRLPQTENPEKYRFSPSINLGIDLPDSLIRILADAVMAVGLDDGNTNENILSAYHDIKLVLDMTDAWEPERIAHALDLEQKRGYSRLLGLFRPDPLPDIDVLNTAHCRWVHPMDDTLVSFKSFPELFEEGIAVAGPLLQTVTDAKHVEKIAALVGNENLDSGFSGRNESNRFSDPYPLGEILDGLYSRLP